MSPEPKKGWLGNVKTQYCAPGGYLTGFRAKYLENQAKGDDMGITDLFSATTLSKVTLSSLNNCNTTTRPRRDNGKIG